MQQNLGFLSALLGEVEILRVWDYAALISTVAVDYLLADLIGCLVCMSSRKRVEADS
jgi:hypothetical protein